MNRKIAIVCANPWETFLPPVSQGNAKKYYQWLHEQADSHKFVHCCQEKTAPYGDILSPASELSFLEDTTGTQFLYVQLKQKDLLKKVLQEADDVLIGMPANRTECDKIYLSLLPWIEKCIFLWDGRTGMGKEFYRRLQSEYKLESRQILEIKSLPPD